MGKQQVIEAIQQRNRTAKDEFLNLFDEHALQSYLRRLRYVHGRRGADSVWVREASTTAIVRRRPS